MITEVEDVYEYMMLHHNDLIRIILVKKDKNVKSDSTKKKLEPIYLARLDHA